MHSWTRTFATVLTLGIGAFTWAQSTVLEALSTSPAGKELSISARGNGKATLYLIGPSHVLKRTVELGQNVQIAGEDLTAAGIYQLVLCASDGCANKTVQILPAEASRLSFLLHPSRVPVSARNAVNATALVFDRYHNIVVAPTKVNFRINLAGQPANERSVTTNRGIGFFVMDSRPTQGTLEVKASLGDVTEPRVIQQVASEACHLKMNATSSGRTVNLQTDPIRDCAGNPLPDGTIVSFTKLDSAGKSTVDTPIKKERATAQFNVAGPARISVACGVVVGNEVALGGKL
jgi:hypothetical protein